MLLFCLGYFSSIPTSSAKSILPTNLNTIKFEPLKPSKDHIRTSVNVLDQLSYSHYRDLPIDDRLSSLMLDRYIQDLDPAKIYFLASDLYEFEKYRASLDDALKSGNLKPGFEIYNRYQLRLIERLTYVIQLIENDFGKMDFNKTESIETDRETLNWPTRKIEADELWRKRLKAAALSLVLTEKPLPEVKKVLMRRYRSKLNRALQNKPEDAFQAYINSLTQTFDPHTQYFSPRTSENFNINMRLSLEGIGAVLQNEDEYTKVVRLVPAGPADKSGQLHPADRIVGVAQANKEIVDVVGWRIDEVVDLIRGPKGTEVRLEVISSDNVSSNDTKVISIIRDKVNLEEQAAKKEIIEVTPNTMMDHKKSKQTYKIGVIDIPTFYVDFKALHNNDPNYRSTTRDVTRLIRSLQRENIDGLVIDLRNNGGGSLQEANTLLGLFIKKGPTVQIRDDRGRVELLEDTDPKIVYQGPLAVLVNRLSASASEIFAGAIQDYQRGLVIGSQTFGKGTVQALRKLSRGQLKITQAKFYRVSGESNQHQGIIPDIQFPSFYDKEEIGEGSLENALPWDQIRAVRYAKYYDLQPLLPSLTAKHQQRIKTDPDFQHLIAEIELAQKLKNQTLLSLNKEQRLQEREDREQRRLALENQRRQAKGLPLIDKLEDKSETEKDQDKQAEKTDDDKPDALLNETTSILTDMITYQ